MHSMLKELLHRWQQELSKRQGELVETTNPIDEVGLAHRDEVPTAQVQRPGEPSLGSAGFAVETSLQRASPTLKRS